jgi:hypothetical protein
VRFVGTVNKDETTKDLSPKVVDRCFFIKLEDRDQKAEQNLGQWDGNNLLLTPDDMLISEMPDDNAFEEFKKQFTDDARKEPHDNKASYFVNISQRARKLFEQLSASGVFKNNEEVKEALLASYIFPKINWPLDEGDYKNLKSKLESITDRCRGSYAKDIYNWMKARSSDGILTYWR